MESVAFDNTPQEAREQDYITSGVFTKKTDAGDLHSFFDSYTVPSGLTDYEVRLCLYLHARKKAISECLSKKKKEELKVKWQRQLEDDYHALEKVREDLSLICGEYAFSMTAEEIAELYSVTAVTTYWPVPFPRELLRSPMTRDSFNCGIYKLVNSLDALERKAGLRR